MMTIREIAAATTDDLEQLNDFLAQLFYSGRMNARRRQQWDRVDAELATR